MEGGTMTMAPIERPVKSRPQADERSSERMGTRVYVAISRLIRMHPHSALSSKRAVAGSPM